MTSQDTEGIEIPVTSTRVDRVSVGGGWELPADESPMPRPHILWRAAVAAAALVCLVAGGVYLANLLFAPAFSGVAVTQWPHSELNAVPPTGRVIIAALLLTYGLVFLAVLAVSNKAVRSTRVQTGPRTLQLSAHALRSAHARTHVTYDEAVVFWQALRYPRERFTRITETAEYGSRTMRISSTFTLSTSDLVQGTYAIPLLQAARGTLLHGVRFSIGDRRVSSLTHAESIVYVRDAIYRLVEAAGDDVARTFHATSAAKPARIRQFFARNTVARRAPTVAVRVPPVFRLEELDAPTATPQHKEPSDTSVAELVERLIRSAQPTPSDTARYVADRVRALNPGLPSLEAAADIVLALRRNYPICVPINASSGSNDRVDSQRITVDRVDVPERRPRGDSKRLQGSLPHRIVGWLEAKREGIERALNQALGVPVTTLVFPLRLAESTDSYHLNLRGPEGHYVSEQEILRRHDLDDGGRVPRSELATLSYAMSPRQGQRTAHIYVRSGAKTGRYEYQAKYVERMPGSMATTFVGAVTTLVISAAIALATLTVSADEQASSMGLLQILLAFPLALTATSSYSHGSPFWGGDLASRLGTLITVGVLAASLWVSTAAMFADRDDVAAWWALVLTTATVNTLFTLTAWLTRVSIHRSFTP